MSGRGERAHILTPDGRVLYYGLDRRIPAELAINEAKPFDEIAYLKSIADFLVKNLPAGFDVTRADVYREYYDRGVGLLHEYMIEIVKDRYHLTDIDINNSPRGEIVKKLYQLGCPPMYFFHKTAVNTATYGRDSVPVVCAPLNHRCVYMAMRMIDSFDYLRGEDRMPYMVTLPMVEILQIEDKQRPYLPRTYTGFGVRMIDFRSVINAEMADLTSKIRVHAIDYKCVDKLDKFVLRSTKVL